MWFSPWDGAQKPDDMCQHVWQETTVSANREMHESFWPP